MWVYKHTETYVNHSSPLIEREGALNSTNNLKYTWTVQRNYGFLLKFERFDVEDDSSCRYDYLRVDNGSNAVITITFSLVLMVIPGIIYVEHMS